MFKLIQICMAGVVIAGCESGSSGSGGAQEGETCAKATDCGSGLACDGTTFTCQTAAYLQARQKCLQGNACGAKGECTPKSGKCIVGSDDDCILSTLCKIDGRCTNVSGLCRATTVEDCENSANCKAQDFCALDKVNQQCKSDSATDGVDVSDGEGFRDGWSDEGPTD